MLRSAIRDDNPVLVFEHKLLYAEQGEVPDENGLVPIGSAAVVRTGSDVTVVATQLMRHRALEAAELLKSDGIDVELVDPRTLIPLDVDTIIRSVEKTSRLVCVQECPAEGSWGAWISALIVEASWESLDARPSLVSADSTPIPYAKSLEDAWLPSVERIASAIRRLAEK